MKELSIEEKAKAYDEALERARCYKGLEAEMSNVFPELKESEDEKIRKEIIEYIKTGTYHKSWIAWLEKQGKKPNNVCDKELSEILGRVICRYINDPNIPYTEREKVSMEIIPYVERLEKQGEQNLIMAKLPQLGKQKSAWSEEDEMFVHGLIRGLAAKRDIHGHTTFSSDCIDITETINWLKSLKDRVLPQNRWKPSDEQLYYLSWIINIKLGNSVIEQEVLKHLSKLYEQLKQL